jgi:hypothetical protein
VLVRRWGDGSRLLDEEEKTLARRFRLDRRRAGSGRAGSPRSSFDLRQRQPDGKLLDDRPPFARFSKKRFELTSRA